MILIVISPDSPFPCFVVGYAMGTWIPTPHNLPQEFAEAIKVHFKLQGEKIKAPTRWVMSGAFNTSWKHNFLPFFLLLLLLLKMEIDSSQMSDFLRDSNLFESVVFLLQRV